MTPHPVNEIFSPEDALAQILETSKEPTTQDTAARGLATTGLGAVILQELAKKQAAGEFHVTPDLSTILEQAPSDMVETVRHIKKAGNIAVGLSD